ncbi:MAG: LysR family transcriptional regulator [Betaproteobacteria bacterium]|nr:LysR family transcriptional regulator [Betaproteobacteria bacterium]
MTIEPNDLLLFARVADEGSLSRAAQRLGVPKSTVSRRIAALEARLGERLLLRTTRKNTVTDFGRSVLEHAHQVAQEVEATSLLAESRSARPSGRLRVSMPGDLASLVLSSVLTEFLDRYPEVSLELDLTARRVDLIGESFDVAIRMGDLPDDATLAARRLATWSGGLYAAPAYLARRGVPSEPEALMEHDALRLLARTGEPAPWVLTRGSERWEGIPPGRATANLPELLIRMARAGAGIVVAKHHVADAYVRSGELAPVLPDWHAPPMAAWAVFPGRRLLPARTRVFVDTLAAKFSGPECQAVDAQVRASVAARAERAAAATPAESA